MAKSDTLCTAVMLVPVAMPMPRNFFKVAALASGATMNKRRVVSLKVKTPELHMDYSQCLSVPVSK
jgi:hypothetical protein